MQITKKYLHSMVFEKFDIYWRLIVYNIFNSEEHKLNLF